MDCKGVTGVRKPTKEVGSDEVFLTVWSFGWMQGRLKLTDHVGVWDEEKRIRGGLAGLGAQVDGIAVTEMGTWRRSGIGRVSSS